MNSNNSSLAATPTPPTLSEDLREALIRIETGECVTDWADQPHEQMQECARAALARAQEQAS